MTPGRYFLYGGCEKSTRGPSSKIKSFNLGEVIFIGTWSNDVSPGVHSVTEVDIGDKKSQMFCSLTTFVPVLFRKGCLNEGVHSCVFRLGCCAFMKFRGSGRGSKSDGHLERSGIYEQ